MHAPGPTLTLAGRTVPVGPRAASSALRREIGSMSTGLRIWFAILLGAMAVGAVAALLALPPGWEVFGTSPSFEWGLMIVGYVFFALMTSGLCLASSLGTVFGIERFRPFEKRHAILAVLSLTTAFGIIALDLHYPVRMVLGAVLVPSPSSPMWWMGVFYGGYLVVLLVEVWSMFSDHPRIHQWACTIAACIAILAPATLGAVFGVIAAKPFWHGPFTPILMVASALLAGTALLGIVFYAVHRLRLADYERSGSIALPSVRLLLGVGITIVSALVIRQVVAGLTGTTPGLREATVALVAGPLAFQFWGVRVILGLVVPALLIAIPRTRTPAGTFAASILALTGVLLDRVTFVTAGQIAPTTTAAGTVSYPYASYSPTLVELGIFAGALAFLAFTYTLAERYLDMGETDVHVGINWPWLRHGDASNDHDADAGRTDPGSPRRDRGRRRGGRVVIVRTVSRHAYAITIAILAIGICALAAFLVLVALPEMGGLTAAVNPTPAPAASAQPTPASGMALSPIGIQMPKDANCEACHVTTSGAVGTKPIPKLAHPLWGFRDCTACHKPDGLVQTAPGHSSLHKDDCLVCHQAAATVSTGASVAPMRPEHMGGDKPCTSCHGVDKHAPLPENMKGRDNCWICHNGSEFTYLFESPSPGPSGPMAPEGSAAPAPAASSGTGEVGTGASWALVRP